MWGEGNKLICPRCNSSFYPEGAVKYLHNWDKIHCYRCSPLIILRDKLNSLVKSKVIRVEEVKESDTFVIVFSNGLQLTAEDGEYGDNAFSFVDKEVTNVGSK